MDKPCESCQWWKREDRPHETFRMLYMEWDVDQAKELTKENSFACIATKQVAGAVDYPPRPDGSFDLLKVNICPEHVDHVDLDVPILIAKMPSWHEQAGSNVIIDGHHRIAKAIKEGKETLFAIALTQEQSDAVYIGATHLGRVKKPSKRKARK